MVKTFAFSRKVFTCLAYVMFGVFPLFLPQASADGIRFKDGDRVKRGTVVGEDEVSITIRFPRESIESIEKSSDLSPEPSREQLFRNRDEGAVVRESPRGEDSRSLSPEKGVGDGDVSRRSFVDLEKRVGELERKPESFSGEEGPSGKMEPERGRVENPMLERELGSIEGIIFWKGEPLVNGDVMVVMTEYAGSHYDAHRILFMGEEEDSKGKRIALSARTDDRGKYFFKKAPPGEYILYWKPDEKTGWVRRIREQADFSVLPGELAVQNIPEGKKK